jgi:hypothetical protein
MSQGFFAELCGSNKTEFSRLMNGVKPMSGNQTREFYRVLGLCEELAQFLEPMPFTWTDPAATREFFKKPKFPVLFDALAAATSVSDAPQESKQTEAEDALSSTRDLFLEWLESPCER